MAMACPAAGTVESVEASAEGDEVEVVEEVEGTGIEHNRKARHPPLANSKIPHRRKYHPNLAVLAALVIA